MSDTAAEIIKERDELFMLAVMAFMHVERSKSPYAVIGAALADSGPGAPSAT